MLTLLFAAALAAPTAHHHTHFVAATVNQPGVAYFYDYEARFDLFDSDHVLFRDSHIALIGHYELTPAFSRLGPGIRFSPIAVWDLSFHGGYTWYFGSFSAMVPVTDPGFSGNSREISALTAQGQRTSGTDVRYDIVSRFKAKASFVIGVAEIAWRKHLAYTDQGPFDYMWDPVDNLTISSRGWTVERRFLLLAEAIAPEDGGKKLWFGPASFWSTHRATDDWHLRVGAVAFYKPLPDPAMPEFLLLVLPWIENRFHDGFRPYLALGATWNLESR